MLFKFLKILIDELIVVNSTVYLLKVVKDLDPVDLLEEFQSDLRNSSSDLKAFGCIRLIKADRFRPFCSGVPIIIRWYLI